MRSKRERQDAGASWGSLLFGRGAGGPEIDGSGVVRELSDGEEKAGAAPHILRQRRGERALCGEEVEDAAHALLVAAARHFGGLLRAVEEIARGPDLRNGRLQRVVAAPDLEDDLLHRRLGLRLGGAR